MRILRFIKESNCNNINNKNNINNINKNNSNNNNNNNNININNNNININNNNINNNNCNSNGIAGYGVTDGEYVSEVAGGIDDLHSGDIVFTGRRFLLDELKILSPCTPSKIVCLGLNYKGHAAEMKLALPDSPILFLKPSTAVIAHNEAIVYPRQSRRVDYEAELGVVIGRRACCVLPEDSLDYVLGYTCANDVTARDLQPKDGQWTYAKGFDTFAPVGPWIETGIKNPENLWVKGFLNGREVQSVSTSDHIFPVAEIIAFVSSCMTLLPGDLIMTGTPSGIGPMRPGDFFEVEISGIGKLKSYVK